jgi:hypothetical protein
VMITDIWKVTDERLDIIRRGAVITAAHLCLHFR